MKYKRTQSSIEFLIIFIFVFVMFFLFISFVSSKVSDFNKSRNELDINDFAETIISEYEIMQKVESGYQREILVSDVILKRFNITLGENYVLIQDIESSVSGDVFHYTFSGVGTVEFISLDKDLNGFNETYLRFLRS